MYSILSFKVRNIVQSIFKCRIISLLQTFSVVYPTATPILAYKKNPTFFQTVEKVGRVLDF